MINGNTAADRIARPRYGRYHIQPIAITVNDKLIDNVVQKLIAPNAITSRNTGMESTETRRELNVKQRLLV
jgi:hypothetical protein